MKVLIAARCIWWIFAGLSLGMALCGVMDHDVAPVLGGVLGTAWFAGLALLPDRFLMKRA